MEDKMKILWFILILAVFLCTACVMTAGPHGASIAIAPPLPFVVELDTPYYVHSGYHYYYDNDRWYYSQKQGGPWIDLPRDRYPKEIRHKGMRYERDRGDERGRGDDKGWKHERGKHDGQD